jgi:transposase
MSELLFTPQQTVRADTLSREDLVYLNKEYKKAIEKLQAEVSRLRSMIGYQDNQRLELGDQLLIMRHKIYAQSSEKRPEKSEIIKHTTKNKSAKKSLPSLRYPELALVERSIDFESTPICQCCEAKMSEMGVTENAEYVTVVQKTYHIVRQKRHKYRCGKCHGSVVTANAPQRIKPGSSFSEDMMIDVAVSKYADHVPIERYAQIAERQGLKGINPQTLIELTHYLAEATMPVYEKIAAEVRSTELVLADETWWRMMENDVKKQWQLWGFFNNKASYFEAHNTRAGEVARDFLKSSKAKYLMSDVFSGYRKCTEGTSIANCYCHAHARRKFVEAELTSANEATPVIDLYKQLYQIEAEIKGRPPDQKKAERQRRSKPILELMRTYVEQLQVLPKSAIGKAQSYLLKHWVGLTQFLNHGEIPIDNNQSERGLRSPVVGRKNYYGNHSPKGARTTAVLYSIMQSCKQNQIDPQVYLKSTVHALLTQQPILTPFEWATAKPDQ